MENTDKNKHNDAVLIVGAGGFIGGFIARKALQQGYETWVAVRETTSRRYLDDPSLHFLVMDYDAPQAMARTLSEASPSAGRWRYIIYNLGATKCVNFADFNRINYIYLRNFTDALAASGRIPDKFLYMSSLSALGPGDEKGYTPLTDDKLPMPDTRYGVSKIKAETHLQSISGFPWIIFRPTGVYGPHERDYLMMVKAIDSGWDFGVGFRRQELTFIYVEDLVDAMFQALDKAPVGRKYIISYPETVSQAQFRKLVAHALGKRIVIPVRLPLWITYCASVVMEKIGVARMQASTLNRDKFRIMKQRNWSCDISGAVRDFGFAPRFDLKRGIGITVEAYMREKKGGKK